MKKIFKIDQYDNIDWSGNMYGIPKDEWWRTFLDCHDEANCRTELVAMLEHAVLTYHGKNPATTILVSAHRVHIGRDVGLFDKIVRGPSYSQYHSLVKQCEKHYCVPTGEIEKLPIVGPDRLAEYYERRDALRSERRSEFYSRRRN